MTSTIPTPPPEQRRKLIEVSIPLEKINEQSAKEKNNRSGTPSTLHLWWSRKPTATARAVLFAQIVDDPSSRPDLFPTVDEQNAEREELFQIIEKIVDWKTVLNDTDDWFGRARAKIALYSEAKTLAVTDPFAGGGSIPLEAQRLGLEAHASDVNPVAVLLEKALIEIPPKFAGQSPIHPGAAELLKGQDADIWPGATGLAEDVRWYGEWMLEQAKERIGHLYPEADLGDGTTAPVIAWLWVRTVTCPNPACGIAAPLTSSWWISKKKDHEAYIVPSVLDGKVSFEVHHGTAGGPTKDEDGTVNRGGARCIGCGTSIPFSYIRTEGQSKRIGSRLMAVVSQADKGRQYSKPTPEHETMGKIDFPQNIPDGDVFDWPGRINVFRYGYTQFSDLFTSRQATAMVTFSELIGEARSEISNYSSSEYADGISTLLAITVSRCADYWSSFCSWINKRETIRNTFSMQAIPMIWNFAEVPPFSGASGGFSGQLKWVTKSIVNTPAGNPGYASIKSAQNADLRGKILSTDPPYYDYIGYSDLSDYFYIWLRKMLRGVYPDIFNRTLVPKSEELVANPYRYGGKGEAQRFFEQGFFDFFTKARTQSSVYYPATVYYAFKQQDLKENKGRASAGWETILEGIIKSGWRITATWPMRSEMTNRSGANGANSLASSIALVLRPRPESSLTTTRRDFLRELKASLPDALRDLQRGAIAPADLPQSAIGPGIGLFSKYSGVLEADGHKMSVRSALQVINEILDEVLSEQEGDYDADTRFALTWFRSYGFSTEAYGSADSVARARNTSVEHLDRAGILHSGQGKVHLYSPEELHTAEEADKTPYDPAADSDVSAWETVIHLAKELEYGDGVASAGRLLARVPDAIDRDLCKQLAFLLFQISEQRGEAKTALLFNQLGTAWNDIAQTARTAVADGSAGLNTGDDTLF